MSIVEVNSLSGYYPSNVDALMDKYKASGLKRAETDGSKLITYWEQVCPCICTHATVMSVM